MENVSLSHLTSRLLASTHSRTDLATGHVLTDVLKRFDVSFPADQENQSAYLHNLYKIVGI